MKKITMNLKFRNPLFNPDKIFIHTFKDVQTSCIFKCYSSVNEDINFLKSYQTGNNSQFYTELKIEIMNQDLSCLIELNLAKKYAVMTFDEMLHLFDNEHNNNGFTFCNQAEQYLLINKAICEGRINDLPLTWITEHQLNDYK
jgi:hypothetical protein